mmetsp:Transcript_14185/g.23712  ORF Transcript_14185/g.23712 Transcript_14185/m.23712 type:complete len:230 (-) Transcript_14185:311-1000(-)
MIFFTFSFAFIVSTKLLNVASSTPMVTESDGWFIFDFIWSGRRPSILFSTSESDDNNLRMSVLVNACVRRLRVTSTSRSPNTIVEPIASPSLTELMNSSPALKPSLSNFVYIPLTALPTYLDPTFTNGLEICILRGGASLEGVDMTELFGARVVSVSTAAAVTDGVESAAPSLLLATVFVLLVLVLLPIPARDTRFASNSTNTTLGLISLTIFPANSADAEEMCAVPSI